MVLHDGTPLFCAFLHPYRYLIIYCALHSRHLWYLFYHECEKGPLPKQMCEAESPSHHALTMQGFSCKLPYVLRLVLMSSMALVSKRACLGSWVKKEAMGRLLQNSVLRQLDCAYLRLVMQCMYRAGLEVVLLELSASKLDVKLKVEHPVRVS